MSKTDVKETDVTATTNEESSTVTVSIENKEIAVTVQNDVDTRDNSEIKVVKPVERLDNEDFNALRKYFKALGGYYSRFKGGFIFAELPAELIHKTIEENKSLDEVQKIESKKKYISKSKITYAVKILAYMIFCNNSRRKYHCRA